MDTTKLNRILDMLDAERIAIVLGNANEMARNTFHLTSNTVSGHPEFYATIMRYYAHHFERTIAHGAAIPEDKAAADVRNILERAYRNQGGYEGAYRAARTGVAGGMNGVLNAISQAMRDEQEEHYIRHVFFTEIDPMNFDEIVEVTRQYLERFGSYLAPSDRARSAYDLARNFDTIIESHARAMSAIRGMLKKT